MRKWLALTALLCIPAFAMEMPTIFGYIKNKAGGHIVFTKLKSNCKQNMSMAFIRDDGGRISERGCYVVDDTFIIVEWGDGNTYTYDWSAFIVSEEFQKYLNYQNGT